MPKDVDDILAKYKEKLESKVKSEISPQAIENYRPSKGSSKEYLLFKKELTSRKRSAYENLCNSSERLIKIKPKEKDYIKLKKNIDTCHLNINPEGAASFATLTVIILVFLSLLIGAVSILTSDFTIGKLLIPLILILISVLILKPLTNIPIYIANKWRLRASNQMVLCILYIVMFMRHTSNLEHGLRFAIEHIGNPLALDLRKVFWDIQTGKYSTLKKSLDAYLISWRDYNLEFVESFHLIEGSLYEKAEERRVNVLEKALDVMLDGTYEKMLHYAQELKNPITVLHMLGIILPILGLVILPLFGSLIETAAGIKIFALFLGYNIILPFVVYIIGNNILAKRPTGFSESNLMEKNPELSKYQNLIINLGKRELQINPFWISLILGFTIAIIGVFPLLLHFSGVDFQFLGSNFIDYRLEGGQPCALGETCYGPFGAGAVLLSLFFPLGIAIGIALYYKIRTRKLIILRNETKKLELEFSGGLFQLGNRVGDNIPMEVAFGEVGESMKGTPTGNFFSKVYNNIKKIGTSLDQAIFNKDYGAIWYYPSSLIETSMKVVVETTKKGPEIVSRSLISISTYVNRIHQVNERVKDLLSEVISSMKSQISFLTPIIAGIVVGITAMIVNILGKLSSLLSGGSLTQGADSANTQVANLGAIVSLFDIPNIIPSYYLQLIVGVYVIQMTIILTFLVNSIENGVDKLNEKHRISKNLLTSLGLYFIVALVVTLIFNLLVSSIKFGSI
ncbi:hypothetical protein CL617_00800 [archaeon]|nr:hypothetical protein [archaeon]|tara:strand:- start:40 stop:2253 length:2214 start_codon:yes stop_codon:yes gene_type:complete